MVKLFFYIFISLVLLFRSQNSFAQSDSLTVFVKIVGPKYEKYRIYYEGKLLLETPRGGSYLNSIRVPLRPKYEQGDAMSFYIKKKGFFRIGYRTIPLGIR